MTTRRRFTLALPILLGIGVLCLASCGGGGQPFFETQLQRAETLSPVEVAVLLGVGTLISEDLSCASAGVLAAREILPFGLASLGCLLGIWLGDLGLYALGRFGGRRLLRRAPFRWWIGEKRVVQGEQLFQRHGGKLVFGSRFLPGSRVPVYVAAGILQFPFWKFALFMALACAVWTPLLVGFSMKLGDALLDWLAVYEKTVWVAFVGVVIAVWLVARILEFGFTHRGRRRLVSAWSRLTEWEFWPMWVFYPPVGACLLFLAIKHRSLTLFTLANPGIPQGGLALESKSEILSAFEPGSGEEEEEDPIARFALVEAGTPEQRFGIVREFMEDHALGFPLVLKPDIGERGQGVAIVASECEARSYLENCEHPVIAQEFVPGLEFGVFYVRRPGEARGQLLSITEKVLPTVTGDGERTMEALILDDPRAVKMAKFFLDQWAYHLGEIPAKGEVIRLTELGTHCRGAVFRDGRNHATEALLEAIESLSRRFEGFYFGRYDLRVPSVADLEAGRHFKVLELNGVTSESTHIYEPGRSLFAAYRDLFQQWRLAFEIGAANRDRGLRPTTAGEVWQLLRAHARHDWFETPPVENPGLESAGEERREGE